VTPVARALQCSAVCSTSLARPQQPSCFAANLCELYPFLEESGLIEFFVPKKGNLTIAKWCVSCWLLAAGFLNNKSAYHTVKCALQYHVASTTVLPCRRKAIATLISACTHRLGNAPYTKELVPYNAVHC
jgi:hypothetical protein